MEYVDFGERKVKGKQIEVHGDNREPDTLDSIINNLDDYLQGENLVKDYSWIQDFKPSEEYKAGDIFKANVSRNSTSDNDLKERLIWVRVDLKPNEIGSTNDLVDAERNNKIYIGPCTHDIDTTKKGYAFDMILEDMKENLSIGKIEGDEFHLMVLDEDPFQAYKLNTSPYDDQRITFCYNQKYIEAHLPYLKNYIGLPIIIRDGYICILKSTNFIDFNANEINWKEEDLGNDEWEKSFVIDNDALKKLNYKEGDIISFPSVEISPNGLFRIKKDIQVGDKIVWTKRKHYTIFTIERKANSTSEASTSSEIITLSVIETEPTDQDEEILEPMYDVHSINDEITPNRFADFFQKYSNLRRVVTNSEETKYQKNPHEYCPFSEILSNEWGESPLLFPKYNSFMDYPMIKDDKQYYSTSLIEYHNHYLIPTRDISIPDFKNNDINYVERYRHPYYTLHPDKLPNGVEPSWEVSEETKIYTAGSHQNAPKYIEAINSQLVKDFGLFGAFSKTLDEYRQASQMTASLSNRWYKADTPLYMALYNFANNVESEIYTAGDYGIEVNPPKWLEKPNTFKSGSIIYDILHVLRYYESAIFSALTPNGTLVYTHDNWSVGSNIGLLDAQLKKVTDQLNAIPATLNPSIDGAIVKKDSTVAENLMLLDTQINNLKQEVEQLKK